MNLGFFSDPRSSLIIILITMLWVLPWKAYALWTAVKRGDKIWFVVLLILNTIGILEIVYIFAVAKKKWSEVENAFGRFLSGKK